MLHELRVQNLLLIDCLELKLENGFNVMTGETGAGKSIVIGALKLILGDRANPTQVRPGADYAEIDALFDASPPLIDSLRQSGLEHDEELIVRRVVTPNGRSRAYLNGRLSAISQLSQLAPMLADIASQHESVSLTDVATHIGYLDSFGNLDDDREKVSTLVEQLNQKRAELSNLEKLANERIQRQEFLSFQLKVIEDAQLEVGELDSLQTERSRLRNAARLAEAAAQANHRLTQDDTGLCDQLRNVVGNLTVAANIDHSLMENVELARSALDQLIECSRALDHYSQGTHADPDRLEAVETRLYQLEQVLRSHGPTEADAIDRATRLRAELDELESVDDALEAMKASFEKMLDQAGKLAFALSRKRADAASHLAEKVGNELAAMSMGGARVVVQVERHDGQGALMCEGAKLTSDGVDRVEFLIAPNKGIEPRPLRKIASGGELSRALLAIKRVLASRGPAGLYVFDEVDAGVGGAVAAYIGKALADIAKHRQVLCITHLAPIAALADAHFVVRKSQSGPVASTEVVRVTGEQRIQEVARMLSGKSITKAALQTAVEMIGDRL